jgi:KaiC/GvpD/RAD55 family RecA-like ATPase
MAPRKKTKKSSAPEPEDTRAQRYDSSLERAETTRSRKAAILQLRMGRSAHVLSLVAGLALAGTAILAYLLENWSPFIDAPEYVTVLKWIVPLAAGILIAVIALALKWEPYFADRKEPHFLLSLFALIVPSLFVVLIVLDEMGELTLGRPDWLYPVSVLGISLTLISLAMTWDGWGRRKIISLASAVFPPLLLTFPMVLHFTPIELASILPMAYLGSAVAITLSGSMLHIIASATSVQEREVLKASDGKLKEQIRDLDRKRVALDYREDALRTKESDLEAYEKRLTEEITVIDDRKKQVSVMEVDLEARAQQARNARQELARKEVEVESKIDTLRLKQADIDSQGRELDKRAKSLAARDEKLSKRGTELDKGLLDVQAKERELKNELAEVAEERSSIELIRKELDALQNTLAEKEKHIAVRETTLDMRALESLTVKKEIGQFAEEKGAMGRLEQQLLMKQESMAEREISLRSQEEGIRKKAERAERLIARADKQMNELVEMEGRILEKEKSLAEKDANLRAKREALQEEAEDLRRSREEAITVEKQYMSISESLRQKSDEVSSLREDLGNKVSSLERREAIVKELETRLKTEHDRTNSKIRELIEKEKSLKARETELGLKHAELKSMERQLLQSVEKVESARAGIAPMDGEGAKTLEARERRLQEKEREMRTQLYQREKELEKRERMLQTHLVKDIEEMGEAVETEYVEEKVKTGIERLDDLLLGGMPFASNVMFVGPPFIGKETAMYLFIAEGLKKGVPAVIVTTSHPPSEIAAQIAPIMPAFMEFDQLGLVHWVDASGGSQPGDDASPTARPNVERVGGPDDFSGIGRALDTAISEFKKEGYPYFRMAYLSLSMSVPKTEDKRTYQFVQSVASKVRQENSVGLYALERGMHTEQQLESIQHQMTGAVQFKADKQKTLLSVHGVCDAQTRDWIEYRHSNKAIMIGAFSLERIR